jgi:ATP-dependent helicase/DNAse subunit B
VRYRNKNLTEINRADLKAELNAVADEVFDAHQRAVPPLNRQVWLIDREMSKLLLEQVLEYELSVERKTRTRGVHPTFFELAFGMSNAAADAHSTDQRLRMYRTRDDQTDTLLLRGQIDRVDIASDKTAIAYDYKLSRGPKVDDMREGRALQLHIYLAALEQLFLPGNEIAGAGYYTMRGGGSRRNQGLYRVKKKDYTAIGANTGSSLSDEDWKIVRTEMETRIWEFVDGLRNGHFQVDPTDPKTTCPYCDFSAVCRYEKFRIRGKER